MRAHHDRRSRCRTGLLDTVVPQEFVTLDADRITVPAQVVRRGETTGAAPAPEGPRPGRRPRWPRAASCGRPISACWPRSARPRCRCCGTCASPSSRPATNCARSASRWTPAASTTATATRSGPCWKRLNVELLDLGVVRDDPAALEAVLRSAARDNYDAVITSGGVSVGDADNHTKTVMARLGDVLFWGIAMRPGRPMAIGRIDRRRRGLEADAILFELPGNPVAVMITFYALVRDALLAMGGAVAQPLPMLRAVSVEAIRKAGAHRVPARHRLPSRRRRAADAHHRLRKAPGDLAQHERGERPRGTGPRARQRGRRRSGSTCCRSTAWCRPRAAIALLGEVRGQRRAGALPCVGLGARVVAHTGRQLVRGRVFQWFQEVVLRAGGS